MNLTYSTSKVIDQSQLADLYNDANWTAYTKDMGSLVSGVSNSLGVITAWDENKLIGLVRVVGDGQTIIYIQDILVKQSHKRKGIGKTLIQQVLEQFKTVRQIVLLTDDNPETRGFYESLKFESCDKGTLVAFAKMQA